MFGSDYHKPRKVTTYGKSGRQQAYTFNELVQASPEKRKSDSKAHAAQGSLKASAAHRGGGSSLSGSELKADDHSLRISAPNDDISTIAKTLPSQIAHGTAAQSFGTSKALKGDIRGKATGTSRLQNGVKSSDIDVVGAQRKRMREVDLAKAMPELNSRSISGDIYDFPDDTVVHSQTRSTRLAPVSKNFSRTPTMPKTTGSLSSRNRTRTSTPEQIAPQKTPVIAKETDLDIYDFPDEVQTVKRASHPTVVVDSPIRKRQKTPAREEQVRAKPKSKVATPERGKERPATGMARPQIMSPKPGFAKWKDGLPAKAHGSNGVMKRRLPKGSSAPSLLFSMIREPPSPPTDSSESAAGPATPEMRIEMDLDADTTPATPPNRASDSPIVPAGSVTPRQKQLWTSLLSQDAIDSPSELSFGKLQLSSGMKSTSRKLVTLGRSASDVPKTAYTRRPRLVDTLKATTSFAGSDSMDIDEQSDPSGEAAQVESSASQVTPRKLRPEVSFKTTSAKVTYGQGRTYLEEKDESKMWEGLLADESSQLQSLYGSQGQNLNDDEDDDDMVNASQLRAAHDLRAAGSRKRLHDELSMLLSDLEQRNHTAAIRRSALKDLAEKLLDKEAASCFLESGLDRTFLSSVKRDTDVVFLVLEAAVIFLLLKSDPTSSVLDHIFHSQVFTNVLRLLDVGLSLEKVLRDRRSNLSKMAQAMIVEFTDQLLTSDLWDENKPHALTPRVFGLQTIEIVVRKIREHGSSYTLLEEETVDKILTITRTEMSSPEPDLAVLGLSLSALQVTTISSSAICSTAWPDRLVQSCTSILPAILALPTDTAHHCVQLALKLAVELANDNPSVCKIMGTTQVMTAIINNANRLYSKLLDRIEGKEYTIALELTLLSYGLTLNLTELSTSARTAIFTSPEVDVLTPSIRLFLRGKRRAEDAESFEDTQTSVVNGYLAFTLGNLAREPAVRHEMTRIFKREMHPRSATSTKFGGSISVSEEGEISVLLDAMQEFIRMNQLTDKREFEGEEGNEVFTGFTERLKRIVAEVGRVT